MKKPLLFSAALLFLSVAIASAQAYVRCGSYEYEQQELAAHPELQQVLDQQEQDYQTFLQAHPNGYHARAVVTVPVVFHIVYHTAAQNISNQRIQEQIQVLNEDYRRQNSDASLVPAAWQGIAADCEVEFCLAKQDPSGNWTDGIDRVQTAKTSFSMNDTVKFTAHGGADAWDRDKYLNIWVCNLSGGLLGYSTFPGGPANKDGCVLLFSAVGISGATAPYNKGRTATHEVGHWLWLVHTWGDDNGACTGTDYVNDTPSSANSVFGCPTFPLHDACLTTDPGVMFMNYMDYTDDACMYMFTEGQKTRIWSALNGARLPIQTSNACSPTGIAEVALKNVFSVFPSPSTGNFTLDFGSATANDVDVTVFNVLGEQVYHRHLDAITESQVQIDLSDNDAGVYFLEVRTPKEKLTRKLVINK